MPVQRDILRGIRKVGLNNYGGFRVEVDVEARIDGLVPERKSGKVENHGGAAGPLEARDKETAAVTFSIQGTAELVERHVPDAGDDTPGTSTSGDVVINMHRDGNRWYWSPAADLSVQAAADIVEEEYLIESVRAAIAAYTRISETLIDGNYDPLVIPVLDNGELIPLEKRRKDADEMAEALDMEKRILQELMRAKLNTYGDYQIKVRLEAALDHGGTSAQMGVMPLTVKGYETAEVRFAIRNGAEAYRKHAPERSGEGCFDGAGGLRVFMKRINGKWYWNPFGW